MAESAIVVENVKLATLAREVTDRARTAGVKQEALAFELSGTAPAETPTLEMAAKISSRLRVAIASRWAELETAVSAAALTAWAGCMGKVLGQASLGQDQISHLLKDSPAGIAKFARLLQEDGFGLDIADRPIRVGSQRGRRLTIRW